MAYFETKNLTFTYPQSSKKALDNVNLNIKQGEFVLIMGKSGSGKSTLLRLLKKEISPVGDISGDIDVNCEPIGFVGSLLPALERIMASETRVTASFCPMTRL